MAESSSPVESAAPGEESESQRLARLNALFALIGGEGLLIWNRYVAFLTANAIVGALLAAIATKDKVSREVAIVLLAVSLFGVILTVFWRGITVHGWKLQHYWSAEAMTIAWPHAKNPFAPYKQWCIDSGCAEGTKDHIATYALRTIYLFLVAYVLVFLFAANRLLCGV